ncbi:hypothetical protein [Pelagibacterium lacus]|uniref:MBL fold metallo-hydrolase n=1 Tax=Pelagibacterium lacus TaxID=2282655 RepID=A0A369W562_9HYPH|nr:hypothetical protein [Pelagibacterium lacus]RDE09814.1 hypothetical protein DVH29_04550 [Pelagibacterium lacus]
MKITWFAAMSFRIQIAGRILVIDPQSAPAGIDAGELVSGADTVIGSTSPALADFDPELWRPRRRMRLIDEEGEEGLRLYRLGDSGLVADSLDDGLLVLDHADAGTRWGIWADGAVAVLSGSAAQCAAHGTALLDIARPRLIALALDQGEIDVAFEALASHLGDASLIVLEPGMAVEV